MEDSQENNIILNNNPKINEIKQRKRRHSLPLKSFKVSSPEETQILSTIFDNIFEDVNIEQNNNPSMIDLGTKINLKDLFEEINDNKNNKQNSNKKVNKKLSSSKTFQTKENMNTDNEEANQITPFPRNKKHKKSYIFNNLLKLKMIKCPRLLEEQWIFEKILLDYNIIDFTSKNNIILYNKIMLMFL